ncbi:hypothetical protein DIPPA_04108 [Diplonema papillatum]|nr:hypothetical protein DIPPA_04108 [Diplonema papillatum]
MAQPSSPRRWASAVKHVRLVCAVANPSRRLVLASANRLAKSACVSPGAARLAVECFAKASLAWHDVFTRVLFPQCLRRAPALPFIERLPVALQKLAFSNLHPAAIRSIPRAEVAGLVRLIARLAASDPPVREAVRLRHAAELLVTQFLHSADARADASFDGPAAGSAHPMVDDEGSAAESSHSMLPGRDASFDGPAAGSAHPMVDDEGSAAESSHSMLPGRDASFDGPAAGSAHPVVDDEGSAAGGSSSTLPGRDAMYAVPVGSQASGLRNSSYVSGKSARNTQQADSAQSVLHPLGQPQCETNAVSFDVVAKLLWWITGIRATKQFDSVSRLATRLLLESGGASSPDFFPALTRLVSCHALSNVHSPFLFEAAMRSLDSATPPDCDSAVAAEAVPNAPRGRAGGLHDSARAGNGNTSTVRGHSVRAGPGAKLPALPAGQSSCHHNSAHGRNDAGTDVMYDKPATHSGTHVMHDTPATHSGPDAIHSGPDVNYDTPATHSGPDVMYDPRATHSNPCAMYDTPATHSGPDAIHSGPDVKYDTPATHSGPDVMYDPRATHSNPCAMYDTPATHSGTHVMHDTPATHSGPDAIHSGPDVNYDTPATHSGPDVMYDPRATHSNPCAMYDTPATHSGPDVTSDALAAGQATSLRTSAHLAHRSTSATQEAGTAPAAAGSRAWPLSPSDAVHWVKAASKLGYLDADAPFVPRLLSVLLRPGAVSGLQVKEIAYTLLALSGLPASGSPVSATVRKLYTVCTRQLVARTRKRGGGAAAPEFVGPHLPLLLKALAVRQVAVPDLMPRIERDVLRAVRARKQSVRPKSDWLADVVSCFAQLRAGSHHFFETTASFLITAAAPPHPSQAMQVAKSLSLVGVDPDHRLATPLFLLAVDNLSLLDPGSLPGLLSSVARVPNKQLFSHAARAVLSCRRSLQGLSPGAAEDLLRILRAHGIWRGLEPLTLRSMRVSTAVPDAVNVVRSTRVGRLKRKTLEKHPLYASANLRRSRMSW